MKRRYTVSIPMKGWIDYVVEAENEEQAEDIATDKWADYSLGLADKNYDGLEFDREYNEEIAVERMFL